MKKKEKLIDLESDEEIGELQVNEAFARKYEDKKRREELKQLEEKYAHKGATSLKNLTETNDHNNIEDGGTDREESESEDGGEDEIGELITPELDAQILKTISSIRAKDEKIYRKDTNFFSEEEMEKIRVEWKAKRAEQKKKGETSMTLKEYHRKRLLEGSVGAEEKEPKIEHIVTFSEEQEALKNELKSALAMTGDEDDGFLVKKERSEKDVEKEEDEYKKFLLENLAAETTAEKTMQNWLHYREHKPGVITEGDEGFLINYILNRGWIDKHNRNEFKGFLNEEIDDDADEEYIEKAEEFEAAYNFRFEQPGADQMITYARHIQGLVRRENHRRKKKRKEKEAKRNEAKLKETEELKRLKNLKKKEIQERKSRIEKVAGIRVDGLYSDLDEDFDAEKFDGKMAAIFNDDYYNQRDDSATLFGQIEEFDQITVENESPSQKASKAFESRQKRHEKAVNTDQEQIALEDEYFKLHHEDKIDGMPTRLHYSSVLPATYGIDVVDILTTDDKLLNRHISLKKLAPYRSTEEQKRDIKKYGRSKRVKRFYYEINKNAENVLLVEKADKKENDK